MKNLYLLILFIANPVIAYDFIPDSNYPPHTGLFVTSFDKLRTPSDTFIVVDDTGDTDDYRYRNDETEYDFTFTFNIRRYIGDVSAGVIDTLRTNGLISNTVKIYIPAFDVDLEPENRDCDGDSIFESVNGEKDEVYLNGEYIGDLHGENDIWVLGHELKKNIFEVDINKLNFPSAPNTSASNTIQVKIDVANESILTSSGQIGCQVWATSIDYVAVEFDVVDPVLLITGMGGSDASYLEPRSDFQNELQQYGILADIVTHSFTGSSSCSAIDTPSFEQHGNEIETEAIRLAKLYGSDSINIITHSKGGLDSRDFINDIYEEKVLIKTGDMMVNNGSASVDIRNPLRVNSYASLSSPHNGTSIADQLKYSEKDWYTGELITAGWPDICDMATDNVNHFNDRNYFPPEISSLTIGANADANGDFVLSPVELEFNQFSFLNYVNPTFRLGDLIASIFYNTVLYINKYETVYEYRYVPDIDAFKHVPVGGVYVPGGGQNNDILVGLQSSTGLNTDKHIDTIGNHKTVLYGDDPGVTEIYDGARDIVINEGLNGVLKWSVQ